MIESKVWHYLFLLTFLESASHIRPSLHGHNNGFVPDDNDVQYLLDNIPLPMHKGFVNSVHGTGRSNSMANDVDTNHDDHLSHIQFDPPVLNFKDRQLGVPHQKTVTLHNRDDNRTIHLSSISGSTQHFHSSFFQDKVIPPLGNTTFNVVFLGREEGEIDSHLYIHTSDGTLKYRVKGISVSSPYRLRPVVGVKLPINASFTPLIYMHNPHPEPLQVMEVYSSGGEFQLELPSGEAEGPKELWEIPSYQTKPVIRLHFNAYAEKNHTAYIRFKLNNSAEVLVVAVEIEVANGAGLHWGGSSGVVNLGMGGSLQPPIYYPIALKNSAKKPIKVVNIISTPVSKALRIDFEPVVIPGETEIPIAVGTLIYDWKSGLDLQHFKGKLMVKGVGSGGTSQKLAIPWLAHVLQGGLEVNSSITHYCSPHSAQPRNFSVVNKYQVPLAITNVSLPANARSLFTIKNFIPKILQPNQKENIFSLTLATERKKSENLKLESSILIHSNVSTTEVPLLSYDGKVRKIIPGERENDKGIMNFGTVSSGTENEAIFALDNQNPIDIELHGWGVNMPGAVLELTGCQAGPTELFNKGFKNVTVCSHTGNQRIKPGYLAVFKIKVKTPLVEEDTIVGDVFVRTTYERLTVPVYMRVAHGKISVKKIIFTDCFPGAVCTQDVKIHSTFSRSMQITRISSVQKDNRMKYIPLDDVASPIISKGENHVGSIRFEPSVTCKQHCYLGLLLNTSVGSQWLNTMSLPSHTRDSDLNLLNTRYTRYLNTSGNNWENTTMRLDTTEVRGYKFQVNVKSHWPSLLLSNVNVGYNHKDKNNNNNSNNINNNIVTFSLTQVGNTSYRMIQLHNPSTTSPILIQLVMDWNYPQGSRLYHSLPSRFKPSCTECPATVAGEFNLDEDCWNFEERNWFEKYFNVKTAREAVTLILGPRESRTVRLSYTPSSASSSSGLLYIRNNMTILEVVRLVGRGAFAQFKFGNRKPGSTTPLLFELSEKHLKDCERDERLRRTTSPNVTVKRSFTARNTGEIPIEIYGFYISGLQCEGYGFRILDCYPFKLSPNSTKKIEIAFTPDFTLAKIERELIIYTSLSLPSTASDIDYNNNNNNNMYNSMNKNNNENDGAIRLTLLTTVPQYMLEICSSVLKRPHWERAIQWASISLSSILFLCILVVSYLEADRLIKGAFENWARENPMQLALDLRLLAQGSKNTEVEKNPSNGSNSNNKNTKKDNEPPDWSLMNVSVNKKSAKDNKGPFKIPDWTVEEEKRFRIDAESKNTVSSNFKSWNLDNSHSQSTKKKSNKKHNNIQNQLENNSTNLDAQQNVAQEKKLNKNLNASSTSGNKKGKNKERDDVNKENEDKERKKQSEVVKNGEKNNKSRQKVVVQFSEEETSSTTTESSNHDDTTTPTSCKDFDCQTFTSSVMKQETTENMKATQRKKGNNKQQQMVNSLEYKDNYEGDYDDDYCDKEDEPDDEEDDDEEDYEDEYDTNRWRKSTTRSNAKQIHPHHHHHHHHLHHHSSRCNSNSFSCCKLSRQQQQQQQQQLQQTKNASLKKDNVSFKRRLVDKSHFKPTVLSPNVGNTILKEDIGRNLSTSTAVSTTAVAITPSLPPPPPPPYWGENRAKFSDVVARNQENNGVCSPPSSSSSSLFSRIQKRNTMPSSHDLLTPSFGNDHSSTAGFSFSTKDSVSKLSTDYKKMTPLCNNVTSPFTSAKPSEEEERQFNVPIQNSLRTNSYFASSFVESPFIRELVPYDDLPETDEPLVELESLEEDTRSQLWDNNSPVINLLNDSSSPSFQLDSSSSSSNSDKMSNLPDTLKDNWLAVETNWEPLYTRAAVGEERSGVWGGGNTGGVWSAGPWGAAATTVTPPSLLQSSSSLREKESDMQERSGFDPFRSLSTIWTPSSTESWKKKDED